MPTVRRHSGHLAAVGGDRAMNGNSLLYVLLCVLAVLAIIWFVVVLA